MRDDDAGAGAFDFGGRWTEYAPIAFTNLLLTIVTIGIYGFWAKTRTRRYLWSRTRFIDERLEWTGTGLELFIGYLLAIVLFLLPIALIQFGLQALILRGHNGAAFLMGVLFYLTILYVVGIAIFRALRYRLSRTYWHGIRGGSDDQGFGYALQHGWRTIVGFLVLGLMVPWSMTHLWNRRWRAMSFGPFRFRADAQWRPIIRRYLLIYLTAVAAVAALAGTFATMAMTMTIDPNTGVGLGVGVFMIALIFYVGLPLIALAFYAAYLREAIGKLSLGDLDFAFEARTKDWVLLFLGNVALVIATLGVGVIFLGYRNWSFFIRNMRGYGELRLDTLTQSKTRTPGQGEGLLDAFDVGAI